MNCDEARVGLGALAIGALDESEASLVREHLAGCAECRAEYEELRDMPRLLGLVTLSEATDGPIGAPARLRDDLLARTAQVRRTERRRRIAWTAAGAVGLAAAAAAVGVGIADATSPSVAETGQVLAAADPVTGVSGQVRLDGVAWGTKLDLELAGVSEGETCSLVAVSTSGAREVTATWTVPGSVPAGKYLSVPGAAGLQPDLIDTFEVVTTGGSTLLSLTFADLVADVPADQAARH